MKHWEDPIVKEVHEIRDQIAAEHHHSVDELCRFLQEQEKKSGREYVTLPPQHPEKYSVRASS